MDINFQPIMREEINKRLDVVVNSIGTENSARLHAELDDIFRYKPVDNYYVWVRAKLFFYEERYCEVYATIAEKESWWFPGPYAPLLAQIQYEAAVKSQAFDSATREKILAYYVYAIATTTINEQREIHADMDFMSDAERTYIRELNEKKKLIEEFLTVYDSKQKDSIYGILQKLFEKNFNLFDLIKALVFIVARDKIEQNQGEYTLERFFTEAIGTETNLGYCLRELGADSKSAFLLIVDEMNDTAEYLVLAKCLQILGKKCILLESAIRVEVDYHIDLLQTVDITLENKEEKDGIVILRPVEVYCQNEAQGSNVEYLLQRLLADEKEHYYSVLTSAQKFENLRNTSVLFNKIRSISSYKGKHFLDEISFGYLGEYTSYISKIYQYSYLEELEKDSECLFSIVIPARNSAYTLKYTLKTCMEQRNILPCEYEILISDNSDQGNYEVEQLVKTINDPRIRYYRTPVELPLQRSFEFAYGLARGRYVLPIGSDDGMLPWALEILKEMIIKYPEEPIIGWERGLFQWSESKTTQGGRFAIANCYQKGEYQDKVYGCLATLKSQMTLNAGAIYAMPLLYINSIFKRKWLTTLYYKTGTIIDGYTQDISMAVKIGILGGNMVYLKYPLTIAGLSDNSLGGQMATPALNNQDIQEKIKGETVRGFGNSIVEPSNPFLIVASTVGMFWAELFRAKSLPICKEVITELLKDHDLQQTLQTILLSETICDVTYINILEKLRYNAYSISEPLGEWFEKVVYVAVTDKLFDSKDNLLQEKEGFEQGYGEDGGLILDAKKFGVSTIYDAVQLFQNILNL